MPPLKRPHFLHNNDFTATGFGVEFDFILAQSIFSHARTDIIARSLSSFCQCPHSGGLVLATFILPFQLNAKVPEDFSGSGWVYPGIVAYRLEMIAGLIAAAGLAGRALPWFHPRQTWFAIAHSADQLPSAADDKELSGAVLRSPDLRR